MEGSSKGGVLSHLSLLEAKARSRKTQLHQIKELRDKVEALRIQRDQLRAEIETHKILQKVRASLDKKCTKGGEEEELQVKEGEKMNEDSEHSQLLRLMARHTQLKDLLHAHHIIGGYNITKTIQGRRVCASLATAYEGVYLETYNVEFDLKPTVRIRRHDVPPFIPVDSLAEQSNMQTDIRAFLDTLSKYLNGYAGRKQQLKLVKERHKSVEVMESNVLCSILVMLLTVPGERVTVLCTLKYTDHTRCLPTGVYVQCEADKELPDSPQWKNNCSLLMETPVHKALTIMRDRWIIA
ncbi:centromere protein O [Xyrichtys novacula]|uniref:Centromere protein O n=1 Tax=Xyrichtys novacula TaxID=13765 RepID=A0AAV1GJQ4_XYRNO|nr:centromere protein O [Xyrichtys novacula]